MVTINYPCFPPLWRLHSKDPFDSRDCEMNQRLGKDWNRWVARKLGSIPPSVGCDFRSSPKDSGRSAGSLSRVSGWNRAYTRVGYLFILVQKMNSPLIMWTKSQKKKNPTKVTFLPSSFPWSLLETLGTRYNSRFESLLRLIQDGGRTVWYLRLERGIESGLSLVGNHRMNTTRSQPPAPITVLFLLWTVDPCRVFTFHRTFQMFTGRLIGQRSHPLR